MRVCVNEKIEMSRLVAGVVCLDGGYLTGAVNGAITADLQPMYRVLGPTHATRAAPEQQEVTPR